MSRMLLESDWNFHFGKGHNGEPYKSDNKYQMFGRSTGHFGSGTYFSTYRNIKDIDDYGVLSRNSNPNFIEIKDHVYRVDFDLYKNLYRVRSKRQGDILYTMMRNLNVMYNRITYMGNFKPKEAEYGNAKYYQIIRKNAEGLGLRCPSYFELTRMAQKHDGVQSFSTLFMEWNGYNGVNVSGIDYYDNTLHGSVIYDLSKVNDDMEEVNPKNLFVGFKDHSYDDTIVNDGYGDEIVDSLRGEYISWYDRLNDMPLSKALRVLKNFTESGNVLSPFVIEKLDDLLIYRYLRIIFVKDSKNSWGDNVCDEVLNGKNSKYYIDLIEKVGAYYWVNYESRKSSGLISLLRNFENNLDWGLDVSEEMQLKEEYLDKLKGYMSRPINDREEKYIDGDFLYDLINGD